jgi:hypothetical protein
MRLPSRTSIQWFDKLNHRIVANTEAMEMEVGSSLLQEI